MKQLGPVIKDVRGRIKRAGSRGLNEQNTKATLIEPVLRALGWDVEDVEEVQREFRIKKSDKPVDYALLVLRNARLFLEAKALGENLDDRRWANQIMGYAGVAGVQWIVLTDGNEYRIYNTHAPVSVEEKLFRTVRVTEDDPLVEETFALLAKDRLEENRIEVLWRAHFVDRQVKAAIERLFSDEGDLLLVNYVAQHTKNLTAEEIRASLRRCQVSPDFPNSIEAVLESLPSASPKRDPRKASDPRTPKQFEVTLADLIQAGLLRPPVQLEREYKGKHVTARIEADGRVTCQGEVCDSLSSAGSMARVSIIGKRPDGSLPATNGWTFWLMKDQTGRAVDVDAIRQRFLQSRGGGTVEKVS